MTYLASHPGCTHYPADCRAFDTEHSAEVWARGQTARGIRSVVVYRVPDVSPYCHTRPVTVQVDPEFTHGVKGPQIDAHEIERTA